MITLYSGDADSQVNAPPALNSITLLAKKYIPLMKVILSLGAST